MDSQKVLARICTVGSKKGNVKVITLIEACYFGMATQKKLEKQKKQWVAYRKKFADRDQASSYIERKKQAVSKFIAAREKEG